MYSDNGTNFTGAERELREAFERLDQRHVCNRLRKDDVQWFFNPPEASHQGGIWERMIRSARKILAALLKEQRINDETLSTLLCETSAVMSKLHKRVWSNNNLTVNTKMQVYKACVLSRAVNKI